MALPLYQMPGLDFHKPPPGAHKGLWYERFFNGYKDDWTLDDYAKHQFINAAADSCGERQTLERARLERACVSLLDIGQWLGGRSAVCKTDWHFVTGLGLPHPTENGFTWHPTLGVPYLCGAAVKGLVNAWAEQWEGLDQATRTAWFGNLAQAGGLIFFDALPVEPPTLTTDVMTPHMGKWYAEGGTIENPEREPEKIPADWHDPTPVPFLAVEKACLLFTIAPRYARFQALVPPAFDALNNALEWLGAGAKTAVGYGRMSEAPEGVLKELNDKLQERHRAQSKAQADAKLAPEVREARAIARESRGDPGYLAVIKALRGGRWSGTAAVRVATEARAMMKREGVWRERFDGKNPRKQKQHKRTLEVLKYLPESES